MMTALLQDLRYAARQLSRAPGFAAIAVAALAIGIGANTAIFSVVNTLLLQRLPYANADRLVMLWEHNLPRNRPHNVVGPANFMYWRDAQQSFEGMAAFTMTVTSTLTSGGDPEEIPTKFVTVPFLSILGVQPARGRAFGPEEDRPDTRAVVISDRLWNRRFGADPGILEQSITLQGIPHSVLGVMPPGFSFVDKKVDLWLPITLPESARTSRGRSINVVARLKPGVSVEQAQQEMTRLHAELERQRPDFNAGWTAQVSPLREELVGEVRPALLVLLGAVAFVLLIACANVANLLLTRATGRQRELAVRAALGAGRGRIVRQLMAESLLLAAIGGAAGLLLAWWGLFLLRAVVAERLPIQRLEAVGMDGWVLAFTLGVSMASGLLFGLLPALSAAGRDLTDALKQGGRTASGARGNRTRSAFVVVEVALALVLLVGAGLLIRSFARLVDVDAGFDPTRTVTMDLGLPSIRYPEPADRTAFYRRLFDRLDALPGVESAGAVSFLPLTGLGAATGYFVVGEPAPPQGQEPVADVRVAANDYLEAMGVPLLAGRLFTDDPSDAANKIIINETMARRHWPGGDALGKRVNMAWNDRRDDEIIGIVGDVKHAGLDAETRAMTYWPHARFPYGTMTLTIRTRGDAGATAGTVSSVVRELDPLLAVSDVRTMDEVVSDSVAQRRMTMVLLGVLAGAALLLAGVGIYGVIAYSVTERTQEIGIRMALGASRRQVLHGVVARAFMLTLAGVAIGAAGAFGLTRLMSGLLFAVEPTDPMTFVAVAIVLLGVPAVASYVPGRRATRVDPVVALRAE